jgi:protein-S-isoprenylcysteine O-methyltransferase Ste14
MRRLLRICFAAIALAGVGAWIAPWILFAIGPRFAGRLAATCVYAAIVTHRLWLSFVRMPDRARVAPEKDWTAIAVGFAYAAVIYAVLIELHVRQRGLADLPFAASGAVLYTAGMMLEMWALRRLGAGWSIQLDRTASGELLRHGPYAWMRHPIYTGAMLEAVAIGLLFGSWWALAAALLLFCPAELARARFEERLLREQFGAAYDDYARHVRGFVPLRR